MTAVTAGQDNGRVGSLDGVESNGEAEVGAQAVDESSMTGVLFLRIGPATPVVLRPTDHIIKIVHGT